jgi:hypothetical protein
MGRSSIRPAPLNAALRQVWRWFCTLNDQRNYARTTEPERADRGMAWRVRATPERLSFRDIDAWAALEGVRLTAWQLAAISMLDDLFVRLASDPDNHQQMMVPTATATADHMKSMFSSLMGGA